MTVPSFETICIWLEAFLGKNVNLFLEEFEDTSWSSRQISLKIYFDTAKMLFTLQVYRYWIDIVCILLCITTFLGLTSESLFQPIRISVCYWKERNRAEYSLGKFPTFYQNEAIDGKYSVYGLPSMEYPGYVKVY